MRRFYRGEQIFVRDANIKTAKPPLRAEEERVLRSIPFLFATIQIYRATVREEKGVNALRVRARR